MADEDEKQEGQNVDEKKGGGKKLLIIGLLAGLIFGGGGAAGYFIFMGGDKGEPEVVEEEIVEEKGPELPDYQYARMDKLQLPVFYNGRVLNYAVMDVSLETIGNDNKMIAVQNVLIVRDALLRHYSINSVGREDNPSIVDFDKLSEKIKEFSNAEAHKDIVTRVIISEARSF
jgi:flagellar protein FliL